MTVNTWDPQYDLALLVLPRATCTPSPRPPRARRPSRAIASTRCRGWGRREHRSPRDRSSTSPRAASPIDATIAPAFQGGPVINQSGQVLAVASRTYSPWVSAARASGIAPYVEAACNKVLTCPGEPWSGSQLGAVPCSVGEGRVWAWLKWSDSQSAGWSWPALMLWGVFTEKKRGPTLSSRLSGRLAPGTPAGCPGVARATGSW